MPLHLHRATSTEHLAVDLAGLLARPLADPFEQEVVVVPAKGVERWLTQRLSHHLGTGRRGGDGVCAGVRFVAPRSLVAMLLGRDHDDPWAPDQLVWPLLQTIDDCLDDPAFGVLAAHLGHDGGSDEQSELRRNRRYSVARRLAGLFASYAAQRPALVADWREGRLLDGTGRPLDDDLVWQARLWQRLIDRMQVPTPDRRHAETVARLREGDDGLDLPGRLSLFGHTRLPRSEVELLAALGARREVHLWLPQASPRLWDDLSATAAQGPVHREHDTSARLVHHPLLASLGRDARELQRSLAGVAHDVPGGDEEAAPPSTLLQWLQHDIRGNRLPSPEERAGRDWRPTDRSVQVHSCHGPSRQVDVLREVLVGLLADDPTLEPRDIVVMCPDIETYAPLISAAFGMADVAADGAHPAHSLRVQLADRALTSTNPVLALAVSLVELAGGRVTASEVLDLLASTPVRHRFGFTDDDLARITTWVGEAGVRWGLDSEHRGAYAMGGFAHNTWQTGLDRLLVGVALAGDHHEHVGSALPVDDVASGDIDLVGRLAEFTDRLAETVSALGRASTVPEWMAAIGAGVGALGDVPVRDAWQVAQFERELAWTVSTGAEHGGTLRLADVRALLASRLGGRPTRANFRTGTLSVCTMVPMRSVPHRVVCLLGLDDGVFPRSISVDGDDVLARAPMTGERDPRSEDRQLLLDALMAAGETLVVCFTGANEHTGAARPPAVPLGELVDAVRVTVDGTLVDDADGCHDLLVRHHPLQPYDRRNFVPGELGRPESFSFDRAARQGAEAGAGTRSAPAPFLAGPLPPRPPEDLDLEQLKRFFLHPVREFARARLLLGTPLEATEVKDAIPIELDALEKWAIGDRLLREVMAGEDATSVLTAEQLRGSLPPGPIGQQAIAQVCEEAQKLYARTADLRVGAASARDIHVDLGGGRVLTGTVTGLHGNRLVSVGYSRLSAKQRLAAWIDLLALSVAHPDEAWTAHSVGKDRAGPRRALAGPLDHRARDWLLDLVRLHDEGMTRPLPAPVKTACSYAEGWAREQQGQPVDALELAAREWRTDPYNRFGITGEDADVWHERVWGAGAPLEQLVGAGLPEVARRIWGPLVDGAERVGPL